MIQRLRRTANTVTGMIVYFQNVQNINITGRISKSEYQYTLQSSDTETLYRIAPELRDKIAKIEGLRDVTTDLYIKNPQMTIEIDREKAAIYGITVDQIRQELFNAFGSRQVATIFTPSNDYQVILESLPEFQADPSQPVQDLPQDQREHHRRRRDAGGRRARRARRRCRRRRHAVRAVDPALRGHPHRARRSVRCRSTTRASSRRSRSRSTSRPAIRSARRSTPSSRSSASRNLPAQIATGFQGTAQVFQESLKGQGVLVLAAIFAAYVVLGILYESFIHPITIISGLPSAGVGALLILMAVQHGPVGHRDDRHRDAGRHREEERDHDDRLRDRAAARRACPPRRRSARPRCCASGRS